MLMLVALTGTGKSTTLEILRERIGGRGLGIIPTRREVADWIAIPLAQVLMGEAIAPVPDRVRRFALHPVFRRKSAGRDGGRFLLVASVRSV